MKRHKISLFKRFVTGGLALMLSSLMFATPVYAAESLINEPYEYPVVPGTTEWAEMTSFPEKIEACKIPASKAASMSTEALIDTILNHPIWTIYFVYDMDSVYDIYRDDIIVALQELEDRENADELLLGRYQEDQVAPLSVNNATDTDGSKSDILEILLAQQVFYDDLSETELNTLDSEVAEKAEIRQANSSAYVKQSPFYSVLVETQTTQAAQLANTADQNQIQPRAAYAYTPNGSAVPIYHWSETVDDAATANSYFDSVFPRANRIGNPTYNYNCHSYAWYNASTSNYYWMDDPSKYWTDGSYYSYTPGSSIAANTRVLFKRTSNAGVQHWHSVLVRTSQSTVSNYAYVVAESKWAHYGLYEHYLLDHPFATNTSYFGNWTARTMTFYHR